MTRKWAVMQRFQAADSIARLRGQLTMKKLQYRLKIVFNAYESSYEELLTRANLPTLHLGRLRTIALETFKCINNIAPVYIRDLVNIKHSSYSFRYENTLQIPTVRTIWHMDKSLFVSRPPECGTVSQMT